MPPPPAFGAALGGVPGSGARGPHGGRVSGCGGLPVSFPGGLPGQPAASRVGQALHLVSAGPLLLQAFVRRCTGESLGRRLRGTYGAGRLCIGVPPFRKCNPALGAKVRPGPAPRSPLCKGIRLGWALGVEGRPASCTPAFAFGAQMQAAKLAFGFFLGPFRSGMARNQTQVFGVLDLGSTARSIPS